MGAAASAVARELPSKEQTRDFVNTYGKEAYRAVKSGVKAGGRQAASGLAVARAITRKLDLTGEKRKKAIAEAREERRRKLLQGKNAGEDEDQMAGDTVAADLKIIEGDHDLDDDPSVDTAGLVHDARGTSVFAAAAEARGEPPHESFYKESAAVKVRKEIHKKNSQARKKKIVLAKKVGEPTLLPEEVEATKPKRVEMVYDQFQYRLGVPSRAMAAIAKLKHRIDKRRKEKQADQYDFHKQLDDLAVQKIDGTDVRGWNRISTTPVTWSHLHLYIIRAPGDCAHEVALIYTEVLPKLRQVLFNAAIDVHVRDLGAQAAVGTNEFCPPLRYAMKALDEPNTLRVILLGTDYGGPWRRTTRIGEDDDMFNSSEYPEQMSELEIVSTYAVQHSKMSHHAFKKKSHVHNTFMYTCVDPDAMSSLDKSPLRALRSPVNPRQRRASLTGSPVMASPLASPPGASEGRRPMQRRASFTSVASQESNNSALASPLQVLKKRKKEEKAKQKEQLQKLNKIVFTALIRDPKTGELRDPKAIFLEMDEDGNGRLDREEFGIGLELSGVALSEEEVDMVWKFLDADGGGDLDADELVSKLETQFEKIQAAERELSKHMPRKLSTILAAKLPSKAKRARVDTMKDFQDTPKEQEKRWLERFQEDLLQDLIWVAPLVSLAAQERDEEREKLSFKTKDQNVLLHYNPGVPEYCCQADIAQGKMNIEPGLPSSDAVLFAKKELLEYCKGLSNWPLVLYGDRGGGKTSLLSDVCMQLRKERPFDHVIFHSVGTTPDSTDLQLVLLHLCCELGVRFNAMSDVERYDFDALEVQFSKLLLKVSLDSTLIIIIDGVDRITVGGKRTLALGWFPLTLPIRCRFILSMEEGSLLNVFRRARVQVAGPPELHEVAMPAVHVGFPRTQSADGSGMGSGVQRTSSASSGEGTHEEGSEDMEELKDLGCISTLASCKFVAENAVELPKRKDLIEYLRAIIKQAEEIYGDRLVKRYMLFVLISRNGVLEDDLYQLVNASFPAFNRLGSCRCSWQVFCALRDDLAVLVQPISYGFENVLTVHSQGIRLSLTRIYGSKASQREGHKYMAFHYRWGLHFLRKGAWYGEGRRAISEIMYHMAHGEMWKELNEIASNLRYIEARCSLGLHQSHTLCHDLNYICEETAAAQEWIKTDFLNVKDCLAMMKRYISILFKNPRWTFSVAANLPDTTGPARKAQQDWCDGHEHRPQLIWLYKPTVESPCSQIFDEHKLVIHTLVLSHDMSKLVAVGQDKDVWVWQMPDGVPLCKLEGHNDHIMSCSFSLDDSALITGSRDGILNSWAFAGEPEQDEEVPSSAAPRKWGSVPWLGQHLISVAAHNSTIWTCANSTTYQSGADVEVPLKVDLGHGMHEIEHKTIHTIYRNFSAKEHLNRERFPVKLEGAIKRTRLITEHEKREMRLHKVRKSQSRGSGARTSEGTPALSRRGSGGGHSTPGDDQALSRAPSGEKRSRASQRNTVTPPDPASFDFKDELELHGRMAWLLVEQSQVEEHLAVWLLKLARAGAIAIFIVNHDSDDPLHFEADLRELRIPVVFLGNKDASLLKEGQTVTLRRRLEAGGLMATGSADCTVKIWDGDRIGRGNAIGRRPLATLSQHTAYVSHVSFSHSGIYLASSSGDWLVILWSTQHFTALSVFQDCPAPVTCSVWSPDDQMIMSTCHDGKFRVWLVDALSTIKESTGPHTGHLWSCAFSDDQQYALTTGHDGKIVLWDIQQMLEKNKEIMVFEGHTGPVLSVQFTKDATRVVSASGDCTLRVWQTDRDLEEFSLDHAQRAIKERKEEAGKRIELRDILEKSNKGWSQVGGAKLTWEKKAHSLAITCVRFSPTDDVLATGSADSAVSVWSLVRKEVVRTMSGHITAISAMCFSKDGTRLASGCQEGKICVWDMESGRKVFNFTEHKDKIWSLDFNATASRLISSSEDSTLKLWCLDDPFAGLTKVPGLTVYSDSDEEQFEDAREQNWKDVSRPSTNGSHPDEAGRRERASSEPEDSERVDERSTDRGHETSGTGERPDSEEDDAKETVKHGSSRPQTGEDVDVADRKVSDVHVEVANTRGSSASQNVQRKKTIGTERGGVALLGTQIQKAKDGHDKMLFKAYDEQQSLVMQELVLDRIAYSCAFSPNNIFLATGSADSLIRMYKFTDERQSALEEVLVLPKEGANSADKHRSFVRMVMFDKDSRRIISAGVDGTLRLWSARNGLLLRIFNGHEKEVRKFMVAPDSKSILSCSLDDTARMWNLDTGQELFQLRQADTIFDVDFSGNGKRIVTAAHDGEFRVWEKDQTLAEKKAARGWPRVRELIKRIVRFKSVPCGLSVDGRTCCSIKKEARLDAAPGTEKKDNQQLTVEHTVTGARQYNFTLPGPIDCATISNDGRTITLARGMIMRVYIDGEMTFQSLKAHKASICDLKLSEDEKWLATGADDSLARVWRINEAGQLIRVKSLKGHVSSVRAVCFSPDGRFLATGAQDLCIKLWENGSWKVLVTVMAHNNFVTAVAFDARGLKMLSGGEADALRHQDRTIRVWRLPMRVAHRSPPVEVVRIQNISSTVLACDFTEAGTRVVGVLSERQVYVWHATQGTPMCWWKFLPFDPDHYGNALWRTALLSLTHALDALIVTDGAGNTFTLSLVGLTPPETDRY